jgi:D-glycero-D-manno-heptose 1,7-bisphosphate phosphatase
MGNTAACAVFLDRDGVIIEDSPAHIRHVDEVRLLPSSAEAIRLLNDANFSVVVVTNQAAVAKGLITEAELALMNQRVLDLLAEVACARIDRVYYCPDHPDGVIPQYTRKSFLRKPEPGMLLQAARDLDLDLSTCYMVGDAETDIIAARRAGVCPILVLTGFRSHEYRSWSQDGKPDYVATDLIHAVRWILSDTQRTSLI